MRPKLDPSRKVGGLRKQMLVNFSRIRPNKNSCLLLTYNQEVNYLDSYNYIVKVIRVIEKSTKSAIYVNLIILILIITLL